MDSFARNYTGEFDGYQGVARRMLGPNQTLRFCLLDEITELKLGSSITATKRLRPDEDYLRDHFPRFPVMPGVLMLEAIGM